MYWCSLWQYSASAQPIGGGGEQKSTVKSPARTITAYAHYYFSLLYHARVAYLDEWRLQPWEKLAERGLLLQKKRKVSCKDGGR